MEEKIEGPSFSNQGTQTVNSENILPQTNTLPVNTQTENVNTVPKKSKSWLKITVIAILLFVILLTLSFWAYLQFYKLAYSDSKYGFMITDQRGWYSVHPKADVYYSLGTSDSPNGKAVSYFGVSPVNHSKTGLGDISAFEKTCIDIAKENNITFVNSSSDILINGMKGFACTSEGKTPNLDGDYIFKEYLLSNNKNGNYDFVISVSYPKNNTFELEKINRILNNFFAK